MFILNLNYVKELGEVEKFLPEHVKYLEKHYDEGHFICSGRKKPRTGGVILCSFESMERAKETLAQDPFYINGIAEYEVIEFTPTKCAAGFESFCTGSGKQ